ncbi:MAG: hypothetical protein IPL79_17670 [Myxococcales bacterium]|nr:hypothetical protein [Myxococcales bacterium]
MARIILAIAVGLVVALGGCFLPLSAGAPQMASTVGKGSYGTSLALEAPTLDLSGEDGSIGVAPAAGGTATVAYGVGDRTDLEVSLEGAMYLFILPMPTGGAVGVRHQVVASEQFDVAIAGRLGGVATSFSSDGNEQKYSATYAAASVAVQGAYGPFRPLLSAQVMPARITRNVNGDATKFVGTAASVTLGAMFQLSDRVQLGPYWAGFSFASERVERITEWSAGVMLAVRGDRRAIPKLKQ